MEIAEIRNMSNEELIETIDMLKSKNTELECELNAIMDAASIGIHISDSNGVTLKFNKMCEIIDGIKAEDTIGRNMRDLVKEGIYSKSVTIECLERGTPVTMIQRVNGRDILATGTPIFKDGKVFRTIAIARDC